MKKISLIAISLVAIVIICGFSGCKNYGPQQSTTGPQPPAGVEAQQSNSPKVTTHQVLIENFQFVPESLTIKAGEAVHWTNKDNSQHKIILDDGSFESVPLSNNGISSANTIFKQEGTFNYHCSIHPSMKGTIIVTK